MTESAHKEESIFQNAVPSTSSLGDDLSTETLDEIGYDIVPHPEGSTAAQQGPVWRVRLAMVADKVIQFGLEINGEIILGRDSDLGNLIDLKKYTGDVQGVSRQHLVLRPTVTNLYAVDAGSTNGTYRNGRAIGTTNPTPLHNGDILDLGGLQFIIYIVERPALQTATLQEKLDQADALTQIAKAITSQLDPDEVLNQVVETAHVLTSAGETAIWLVDEKSGELFLEAEKGIEDEHIRRMRLPISDDNPAGKVIRTGEAMRAVRKPGEDQIKVKTGYLVESLLYVPITLGGVTFGVMAAGHREGGKGFSRRDERLLTAIADFAAIAIQNARVYQATDQALEDRVKELSALNQVSRAVSSSLNLGQVYQVMVTELNRHWPVEAVQLYLMNERQGGLVHLRRHKNEPRPKLINQGLIWQTTQLKQAISSHDVAENPGYIAAYDNYNDRVPESLACIPLIIKNKVVGVLALINKKDGQFSKEDMNLLRAMANPVATAIENARLFAESRKQQAAIQATAHTIGEPLIILDEHGQVLVSNDAARYLLDNHMSQLFEGISRSLGNTREVTIGDATYLSTSEHLADIGTIVVMQDITYVKRLEEDRAEFLRALSHDLKSPLTSIKGFAQLLDKVMTLNDKGERFVNQIVEASDRMLNMINQMLQLSRDEVIEPERAPCELNRIVDQVLKDVEGSALHKNIQLRKTIEGEPYTILADNARMYHMILNLVDNAVKYAPGDTSISINLEYREEMTRIFVQDEGPGIPENELPYVFEKYFRGEHGKKQGGTGVGLSVVWAIADAHGGQVTVRNLPLKGVEFAITLPADLRFDFDN